MRAHIQQIDVSDITIAFKGYCEEISGLEKWD